MTTPEPNGVLHRNISGHLSDDISSQEVRHSQEESVRQWHRHVQKLKAGIVAQLQNQLSEIVDKAVTESSQPTSQIQSHQNGRTAPLSSKQRKDDGKVFVQRVSLLDELFEISHIRTIYHMFLAIFFLFGLSTLTVDYLEHGRLVLEFDLIFYSFGQIWTVICAWMVMFLYTLLVPYQFLVFWGSLYHSTSSKLALSLATAVVLCAVQSCALGLLPIYVVVHNQLPPASRFIVILEQVYLGTELEDTDEKQESNFHLDWDQRGTDLSGQHFNIRPLTYAHPFDFNRLPPTSLTLTSNTSVNQK